MHEVSIEEKILSKNDEIAGRNRAEFQRMGIYSINMVSSPGSGKTSIVEKTIGLLKERLRIAVIVGDIQTDLDSRRIAAHGVPVKQITTGRACHLDAHMLSHELNWLSSAGPLDLLIIENVGNMVCPAEYDLGEDAMAAVMSVTEGDDKPLKYPALFAASECLVINKTDLLRHTDFNIAQARDNALKINPGLDTFLTSCVSGDGLQAWADYLQEKVRTAKTAKA